MTGKPPMFLDLVALETVDTSDRSWKQQRACTNTPVDVFFPEAGPYGSNRDWAAAKAVCARCPVQLPCLAEWMSSVSYSLDRDAFVGGTTPSQRDAIRKLRKLNGVAA